MRDEALEPDQPLLDVASRRAVEGETPGRLFWIRSEDLASAAVILAPELPLRDAAQGLYVTALALGDALGSLIPSLVEVSFTWPTGLCLNGAQAGRVMLRASENLDPEDEPDWMVVGFSLAVGPATGPTEPGEAPQQTTLYEEGCGGITSQQIVERFGRHFLTWINRWQDDGFEPVRQAWQFRGPEIGEASGLAQESQTRDGRFDGLDEDGNLCLRVGDEVETVDLMTAIERWPGDG